MLEVAVLEVAVCEDWFEFGACRKSRVHRHLGGIHFGRLREVVVGEIWSVVHPALWSYLASAAESFSAASSILAGSVSSGLITLDKL